MSTQPLGRRRLRPARRRLQTGRLLSMAALLAGVFAATFVIAHTSGAADPVEHLPPSLPRVSTPVPAALATAPAIELAVQPPPPPPKPVVRRTATTPAPTASFVVPATPVQAPPVQAVPIQTTPAPAPTPAPSPAPSAPSKSGSGSNPGSGGGAGTSFESSN